MAKLVEFTCSGSIPTWVNPEHVAKVLPSNERAIIYLAGEVGSVLVDQDVAETVRRLTA